jgi:hypothetical protein
VDADCDSSSKEGVTTSGNTFEAGGNDYYKFYIISSKHNGELRIKDENIKYALPIGIRSQFMDSPGFLGVKSHILVKAIIDASGGTLPTNDGVNYTGGIKYRRIEETLYECAVYEGDIKIDAANSPLYGEFSSGDLCYDQRSTNLFDGEGNALSLSFTPYAGNIMFIKIPVVSRSYPNNTY